MSGTTADPAAAESSSAARKEDKLVRELFPARSAVRCHYAEYQVPGSLITKPGKYQLAFRMRSRAEPIYFMRFVRSTKEMEQTMNERIMNFHAFAVDVDVKG